MCNSLTGELSISNYSSLASLIVKKNSLKSVTSLLLRDLPHLKRFEIESADNTDSVSFANVKEMEIISIFM